MAIFLIDFPPLSIHCSRAMSRTCIPTMPAETLLLLPSLSHTVQTRKNAELPTPLIRERSGLALTQLFIDCSTLWRSDGDLDNIDEEGEVYFNEVTYSLAAAVVQHTCSTAVSPQQTGGLN